MRGTAKNIFGAKVADQTRKVWGFDDQGEIQGIWRSSGHPGFWYHGGVSRDANYSLLNIGEVMLTLVTCFPYVTVESRPVSYLLSIPGSSDQSAGGGACPKKVKKPVGDKGLNQVVMYIVT